MQARLVTVVPDEGRVVDLRTAYRGLLERQGAAHLAAGQLAAAWFPSSMTTALGGGARWFATAEEAVDAADERASLSIEDVTWLAPVDPPILRDALVFEEHLLSQFGRANIEVPKQYYRAPVYYKANPTTLYGHGADIPWPYESTYMDYELEVGFVLWKPGQDLTPAEAAEHLFGVTVLNDFSARDVQGREMSSRLGPAKGKDFATALGPWITTVDEIDLQGLEMVARVNGELWSQGTSADMMWSPEEIVAYVSQWEAIVPGEVIGSGTVGSGSGSDLGRRLSAGDLVELEISGLGMLRNRLGSPQQSRWWPSSRLPEGRAES